MAAVFATGVWTWRVTRKQPSTPAGASLYTDSRQCKGCHTQIYLSYQHVGMARSFAEAGRASSIEDYEGNSSFVHQASGRHYEVVRRGDQVFQRRYELDSRGNQTNVFEQRVTYAIGSGNHARTYLHRSESGELTELPLTWYSQEKRWDMSPGFDSASPPDFTRTVDDRCLFCHNAYPAADGSLAAGIDCQRCHGPGARHVEIASSGNAARAEIAGAIVNPARLSPERRMDVCMQCHLETTSAELPSMIRRFDRDVYSFRPGEALGAYNVQFDEAPGTGRQDKFEIVNQAYRLRQSACFLKSAGRLTCTTCHDPHTAARGEAAVGHYRAACLTCHSQVTTGVHRDEKNADCTSCHMPRRPTDDVVHVAMTDHLIQKRQRDPQKAGHPRGQPVIYYPDQLSDSDRDLYLGAALISGQADRRRGIQLLHSRVQSDSPAKAMAILGEGYLAEGNAPRAIEMFRRALAKAPGLAKAQYNLGEALQAAGRTEEARQQYGQAIEMHPPFPEAEYALANLLLKSGAVDAAEKHYQNAIRARPAYVEAHGNLGNLYAEQGSLDKARAELEEALRIDPAFAEGHNNLGRVLAAQHLVAEALEHVHRAVALNPNYTEARYNMAQLLQASGNSEGAIAEYRRTLTGKPDFVEAHLGLGRTLGDAGRLDAAIAEFREVLRLRPDHAEARRDLDTAVTMKQRGSR
jgi:predicted CXXCH cytochrome family protein